MSHIEEAKDLGIEALLERHWNDPVDREDMAKTIVMTQQGKVLHKEDNYWSDYKVFCKKMIPVIKTYGIEIKNILAAALKAKNGDREAALQVMGTLGLDWDQMGKMEEMKNACREVSISKTAHIGPSQLSRSKFTKTLLRYYSPEENPENPLQSIYHALLYWAKKRFEREESEKQTDHPFSSGSTGVVRRDIYKS